MKVRTIADAADWEEIVDINSDGFDDLVRAYNSPHVEQAYLHFVRLQGSEQAVVWRYFHRKGSFCRPLMAVGPNAYSQTEFFICFKDSNSISLLHFDQLGGQPSEISLFKRPEKLPPNFGWDASAFPIERIVDLDSDGELDLLLEASAGFSISPRGLMAVSPARNEILWYFPVPGPIGHNVRVFWMDGAPHMVFSSAAVSNGRTVVIDSSRIVAGRLNKKGGISDTLEWSTINPPVNSERQQIVDSKSYITCLDRNGGLVWQKELFSGHSWGEILSPQSGDTNVSLLALDVSYVISTRTKSIQKLRLRDGIKLFETMLSDDELIIPGACRQLGEALTCDTTNGIIRRYDHEGISNQVANLKGPIERISLLSSQFHWQAPIFQVTFHSSGKVRLYEPDFKHSVVVPDDSSGWSYTPMHLAFGSYFLKQYSSSKRVSIYYRYDQAPGHLEYYGFAGLLLIPGMFVFLLAMAGYKALPPLFTSPKADVVIDHNGLVQQVSHEISQLMGLGFSDGKMSYRSLFAREDTKPLLEALEQTEAIVSSGRFEMRSLELDIFTQAGGGHTFKRLQIQILPLEAKMMTGKDRILITCTDITRRYVSNLLNQAHHTLFHLSHSTKNQLIVAQNHIARIDDLIRLGSVSLEPDDLDRFNSAKHNLASVIELNIKAINFSHLSPAQLSHRDEPISVELLTRQVFAFIEDFFPGRIVTVYGNLADFEVMVNRGLFRESIKYIVENGIEASQLDSKVVLMADVVGSADKGNVLQLTVTDYGKGISEEIRAKIFSPDFTTREQQGGTGLGLSRAMVIISYHGGEIAFDSREGEGTEFKVSIPCSRSGQSVANRDFQHKRS